MRVSWIRSLAGMADPLWAAGCLCRRPRPVLLGRPISRGRPNASVAGAGIQALLAMFHTPVVRPETVPHRSRLPSKAWVVHIVLVALACFCVRVAPAGEPLRLAAVVTVYHHNSHADVIVGRVLEGYTLDYQGEFPRAQLVSLYVDQVPEGDKSRALAAKHGFALCSTVEEALTLGGTTLAVDGVLLICEHGKYPENDVGQIQYPKRRLFGQIAAVFRRTGRSVPVFCDKHLADNWEDAQWLYETARELRVPLMAGSSLPTTWRYPPLDTVRNQPLREVVVISYHTLDAYGFHALEALQSLVERRAGGETGVKAVQTLEGDAVWDAMQTGRFDRELFQQALDCRREKREGDRPLRENVHEAILCSIEYNDGLRATMLTLNYAVVEWAAAWRYQDGTSAATLFWTQEERPFMHFSYLFQGIEQMMLTGQPAWPVERTLLTSGTLSALHLSRKRGGARIETPHLNVSYQSNWNWQQPPPPPPGRPINEQ